MKENEENNTGIPIEPITTVEAGCGIPVSNKRKASLEGLDIVAGHIIKDRTDVRKNGMESLFLITDAMRSCPKSSDMASRAILCFGGDDGSNIEGQDSIRVDVFSIFLIGWVDDNKECFEDIDYNKPIYNFRLAVPVDALDLFQPKISPSLSFSSMYRKSFIRRRNRTNSQ